MTTYLDQLPLDLKIEEAKFVHKEKMKSVHKEILERVLHFEDHHNFFSERHCEYALALDEATYFWSFTTRPKEHIVNIRDIKLHLRTHYLTELKKSLQDVDSVIKMCKKAGVDHRQVLTSFYNSHI
jgi:hypothetical protein